VNQGMQAIHTYSSLNLLSGRDVPLLVIPYVRFLARLVEVSLLIQIIYLETDFEQLILALLLLADPSLHLHLP
jgi:hypothetical protein